MPDTPPTGGTLAAWAALIAAIGTALGGLVQWIAKRGESQATREGALVDDTLARVRELEATQAQRDAELRAESQARHGAEARAAILEARVEDRERALERVRGERDRARDERDHLHRRLREVRQLVRERGVTLDEDSWDDLSGEFPAHARPQRPEQIATELLPDLAPPKDKP